MSQWVKCSLGCGISHRDNDAAPVHDAQWASEALRSIVAQASERGIVLMFGGDGPAKPPEVVN